MTTVTGDPVAPCLALPAPPPPPSLLYRMSLDQFEAAVAAGVFTRRDRVSLIEGILVATMSENPPHAIGCELCCQALSRILPQGWHVRSHRPLRIPGRSSLPEPGAAVARGEVRDYLRRHPEPGDVALVVEVSDSRFEEDRALMSCTYGGGSVDRYYIVNLVDRQVELYTQPSGSSAPLGYRHCEVFLSGQSVPIVIEGTEVGRIPVSDLLP
jgi:hypothetical protein